MSKSPELMVVLTVNGSNVRRMEAFELYRSAFGAVKLCGELPPDDIPQEDLLPDELELHIIMEINGRQFGIFPGEGDGSPGNVNCQFHFGNEDDFRKAYDVLTQDASKQLLERPFWCGLFGLVTDKFGIRWALVTD